MSDCMPKEMQEYIEKIEQHCLEATNMTPDEAYSFAFRCWQLGYERKDRNITLRKNDVIQITEDHKWAGSFAVVDFVRDWGIQVYVPIPQQGSAFIRLMNGEFEKVGEAVLIFNDEGEE